jgi:hypothetical protein
MGEATANMSLRTEDHYGRNDDPGSCGKAAAAMMPEPGNLPDMKVQAALPPDHAELIVPYTVELFLWCLFP